MPLPHDAHAIHGFTLYCPSDKLSKINYINYELYKLYIIIPYKLLMVLLYYPLDKSADQSIHWVLSRSVDTGILTKD